MARQGPSPARPVATVVSLLAWSALLLSSLALVAHAVPVQEARLVAVDLGAEWIKAATLDLTTPSSGAPAASVNILLNDQANRRSPPCVAFRCMRRPHGGDANVTCERSFAEEALSLGPRFPTQVVCGAAQLLGFTTDEAVAAALGPTGRVSPSEHLLHFPAADAADRFLYHVSPHPHRGSVHVHIPRAASAAVPPLTYTPEELTGMVLGHTMETVRRRDAERNGLPRTPDGAELEPAPVAGLTGSPSLSTPPLPAGHRVRHAAITVPSFSTVAERQAVVDAGELSGVRVVRLVHSVTAAATALAYYREEQLFSAQATAATAGAPVYVMVYDMGSRQTEAAVFAFAPEAARGARTRGVGALTLVAMATNRTLGGATFDQCIASYWDRTFLGGRVFAPAAVGADVAEKQRAGKQRAAMLRAANKARERLSANKEAPVTVEGVAGGHNGGGGEEPFSTTLSRPTFEQVCGELFKAAVRVRDDAIAASHGAVASVEALARFEVVGGATRMPRILHMVSKGYRGGVVDRTLNGDEAVAVGTAYLGATTARMLPRKFRVQEALTNDIGGFLLTPSLGGEGYDVRPLHAGADEGDSAGTAGGHDSGNGSGSHRRGEVLFRAHDVQLPATRTVQILNLSHDAVLTLAAPPGLAGTVLAQQGAVCPGCFLQHNSIEGVAAAVERAEAVALAHTRDRTTVRRGVTEVVLEVVVTESGLPYLHKAYLRVAYEKEVAAADASNTTRSTTETAAEVGNTTETAPDDAAEGDAAAVDSPQGEEGGRGEDAGAEPEAAAGEVQEDATTTTTAPTAATAGVRTSRFYRTFALTSRVLYPGRESPEVGRDSPAIPFASALPRGANLFPHEAEASRATLRQLQRADGYRYACSHLRNVMEGHLISLRALDAYETERDVTADALAKAGLSEEADGAVAMADLLRWRDTVRELGDWLDDYGDAATREELAEKGARVERLKAGVARVFAL